MHYQRFLRQSTYRRYGIFIVTILFGYYGLQAYLNNINIEQSIAQTKTDRLLSQEKIDYLQKFYSPYLASPQATYFLGHENGSLFNNERIIRIKYKIIAPVSTEQLPASAKSKAIYLSSPQESWLYFIDTKLSELQSLGLIN